MINLCSRLRVVCGAVFVAVVGVHFQAIELAHLKSDIPVDSGIIFGKLDNGIQYLIAKSKEPVGRASVRLCMDVGSLMEDDDQRGMAHFLEHMAFNGSKNFASGEMVEYFQRLGMAFGADTNAHTYFNETIYKLELPEINEKYLEDSFKLMRDYVDGMKLDEKEIDRERGIILSEKLARDSVEMRSALAEYDFILPESLISRRMPIGEDFTIKEMKRSRFVDFYQKWYTADRAFLVFVGDYQNPEQIVKVIEKYFADITKKPRVDNPDFGKVSSFKEAQFALHTEKEADKVSINFQQIRDVRFTEDNFATRRKILVRDLADAILSERLSKLQKKDHAPFLSAGSYSYDFINMFYRSGIEVYCKPELWKESLTLIENELRRAVLFGFSERELNQAKSMVLTEAKMQADQAETRKSRQLSDTYSKQIMIKAVITDPREDFKWVEGALTTISVNEVRESLGNDFKDDRAVKIYISGNLEMSGNAEEQIRETYRAAQRVSVEANQEVELKAFAYTDFGSTGKVIEEKKVEDLDIYQYTFENGIRVNLKKTPFEKGVIRWAMHVGQGRLSMPKEQLGLVVYADAVFMSGGLKEHSVDEIQELFAAKNCSQTFKVGDDAFVFSGKTNQAFLLDQLQLISAYLTSPGYREEAQRSFQKGLDSLYINMERTPEGRIQDGVMEMLRSNDPRFVLPQREILEKRNLEELKAWLKPALEKGYLEISLVGDLEEKGVIEALAKTLGALPKREFYKKLDEKEYRVEMPTSPQEYDFSFVSEVPKSYALTFWKTEGMRDMTLTRRLNMLSMVLDDRLRLKIREQMGDTYSPSCYHNPSDVFYNYGYITAMLSCKPEKAKLLADTLVAAATELAKGNIEEDEFERAKKPLMNSIQQQLRGNSYWIGSVLSQCQARPERLERCRTMVKDNEMIRKEDLVPLAKKYLGAENALKFLVIAK